MKKIRVCVVTGSRAEFGIWRPVLAAIQRSPALALNLVVTGMHLLKGFGQTVREIEGQGRPGGEHADGAGFKIAARVPMYKDGEAAAASLARGTQGLADAYRKVGADLVMVLGDRLEMLAAAGAALAERIPIAHVHGGETAPGVWDEQIRHAITKMAHVHFCATKTAGRRILRMGEPAARVHVVGAPALDSAIESMRELQRMCELHVVAGMGPILLLHPSGADEALEYKRTLMVIDALRAAAKGLMIHAIGPNNDPGHQGILKAYAQRRADVDLMMSLPQKEFWLRLFVSDVLIGNSSCGIIEAATWGVPVVNIGDRQAGRERNANVIDVGWNAGAIEKAIRRAQTDQGFRRRTARRKNLYGDGHAAPRIVAVLEQLARDGIPLEKRFAEGPS